jgi:hypothetical protein
MGFQPVAILDASLHEDVLVVVPSVSQRHAPRYWERGYSEYCRTEMELAEQRGVPRQRARVRGADDALGYRTSRW